MANKKFFSIKGVIGWLVLVFIFFILIMPCYTDYTVRAQMSESLSLAYGAKHEVMKFYEDYQKFPTNEDISAIANYKGKYVEQVYFAKIEGSDFFYIVSKVNNDSNTDRRIKNKSIILVIEPAFKWQYKVACNTNLNEGLDDCSKQL